MESNTLQDLERLLKNEDFAAIALLCENCNPALIAEQIVNMPIEDIWKVLECYPALLRSEIFSYFNDDLQLTVINSLPRMQMAHLLSDMPPDDRAHLFRELTKELQEAILPAMAQAEREDIRRLASYEEGTAGSVMTSDYADLRPNLTASQAVARLREIAPDRETIYYAYVLNESRTLLGFVSLKDLILARQDTPITALMHEDIVCAYVDEDQEDAARRIQRYGLLALPVVTRAKALVGIITHDDAMDIITQEHTEDMEKIMAIAGAHEPGIYLKTSSWKHFKNRVGWVAGLAALGLISGSIIHHYEDTLMQMIILALYMPMIADTGGNTGSQAATVVVRALALREISAADLFRVLFKELKIAFMLSAVLGVLAWGRVLFLSRSSDLPEGLTLSGIGLTIAAALMLQVISATSIGAILPLCASKLKLDPAIVASPALTTCVDISGLLIYFTTAKMMLGI